MMKLRLLSLPHIQAIAEMVATSHAAVCDEFEIIRTVRAAEKVVPPHSEAVPQSRGL